MNISNLFDYSNSIFNLKEKINGLERKNKRAETDASTAMKMLVCMSATGTNSINNLESKIFNKRKNSFKNIFGPKEFIPKTHALRECADDINYKDVRGIHLSMIEQMKKNKVFENHQYRGNKVAIVDGVELFETKKEIEGLHLRKHKDGSIGHYFKALGMMYLSDDANIMLDMIPFEKQEVQDDTEHNQKVKSEGEITVFKRVIKDINDMTGGIDIAVADCMFLNAPCMNHAKRENIDMIVKLTDERRDLFKDASKLFESQEAHQTYEVVEGIKNVKKKYSKESHKKNTEKSEKYYFIREVTDKKLQEKITVEDKITEHPKYKKEIKVTERVIMRTQVWADDFEMNGYEYGKVKVIRVKETKKENGKEITKEMYIVTTLLDTDLEFIIDLMHRRWDIELKGFRTLKSRHHMDHLFIGTDNAIRLTMYVILIVYNLIALYFNIHTSKYRNQINFKELLEK